MMKVFVLLLLMTCVVFCVDGRYIKRGCRIPTGPESHQAKFRMGRKQLRPGKVIRYGERVTVACKKDIYGDAIHSWSHHFCRGVWTPSLPSCKAYERCKAPPKMNNMIATVSINPSRTFPHGDQIRYTCKEGYNRKGDLDFIKCRNGQWTPVGMSCEVNSLPFGKPQSAEHVTIQNEQPAECNMNVDNGQLTQIDNGTGSYTLHCETGYQPQRENYVCQEGAWLDNSPKCDSKFSEIVTIQPERPAECDMKVDNGHLSQTDNETGTYTLHCETGYQPQRENYVCQEGAWLDKSPKCVSKFSEIVTIQPERPAECDMKVDNGHLSQTDNETGTYTLHCETGYQPQRENYVCQEGAWLDKSPKCDSKFSEIVTIQPERPAECDMKVDNGHLSQTDNETGTYTLHCETGYQPQRESYVCQEGAWLDKSPKCVSKRCHKIKSDYKLVEGENLNHGAEIILRCNENTSYPHFGIERAWCFNGQWLPRRPECKNYCELPTGVNSLTDVRTNRPSPRLVMHAVGVHQMCGDGSFQYNKCLNGKWMQDFLQCN
ncbi:complement factor H-like isoform X2 [Mya arenaria]|uniref:complement factor H-like isoform X2 n=1 Tax=Mya arenaria TaxID=6604 RepID=UPI0022E154CE|nr:complement factor H-like isoform X2 [Mya arenaria]